ncbi:hypothetical protein GSI_09596 [Ganoderma sinense ZZ0214-1]|uniref:Transporter n=1 Tax=Ganoderma sinense ZZ0214-1 TaxID=1077348 RepID=A0A2G8S3K1_9APHY|nr:hypothetical protein GSI_09596 [Ganoderma sinense ZZ0214-1]
MKFALALAAFAASALAQHIEIGAPTNFAEVKAGSKITVEVNRPCVFADPGSRLAICPHWQNSLTGSTEVGIAIGLWPCGASKCASTDVSQVLGTVVYAGAYKAAYDSAQPSQPPHQTFEVTVPASFAKGEVSLGVAHLFLMGAGSEPVYEFVNTTLVVS